MKKELESYCTITGEYYNWTYCPNDNMWYEDDKEVLPEPLNESEFVNDFTCEIQVDSFCYLDDNWEDVEEENELENFIKCHFGENLSDDSLSSSILFKTQTQDVIFCWSQYGIWNLSDFIEKLKSDKTNYVAKYIEQYCAIKLIAWKYGNGKTHLIVHSYNDVGFEKILFDMTIDNEILISKFENILNIWKETVLKELNCQKDIKHKCVHQHGNNAINHFFPEFSRG